jgi:hypothetical protein
MGCQAQRVEGVLRLYKQTAIFKVKKRTRRTTRGKTFAKQAWTQQQKRIFFR